MQKVMRSRFRVLTAIIKVDLEGPENYVWIYDNAITKSQT